MKDQLHPKRLLSALIILAIGFIFAIQWGPGSRGCDAPLRPNSNAAATVNGKDIPLPVFQRAYAMQLDYARRMGRPIPESLARQLGFPRQVLESLIQQELLSQAAERHGIEPSDVEMSKFIHSQPDFQVDGKFDFERYKSVLRDYYRKTVPEYETDLRRQLAGQKMLDVVQTSAVVSDDEVKARYQREGDKANITFARFLPSMYADKVPAPAAAEVAQYVKDHQKEIAAYYDQNRSEYEQPEKVRTRHILLKVPRGAAQAQKDEVKKRAEEIRKEILGGKDFAEAAKQYTEDTASKENGGDLGFLDRSALVPPYADAAFKLQPGQVSDVVETMFGFHIIKVEEKKPGQKKELKDVQDEIAATLIKRDRAKQMAKAEADKALAALQGGKSLADQFPPEKEGKPAALRFETETRPEAIPTGDFNAGATSLPYLGSAPDVFAAVFAAKAAGPLPKVFDVGDGYAVVQVTSRQLPSDQDFSSQKVALRDEAMKGKQDELRSSFVQALRKDAKVQINADAVSGEMQPGGGAPIDEGEGEG